jgi:hypothetical protein
VDRFPYEIRIRSPRALLTGLDGIEHIIGIRSGDIVARLVESGDGP